MVAWLDVIEKEPLELINPLSELKDLNQRCVDETAENIKAVYKSREVKRGEFVKMLLVRCA